MTLIAEVFSKFRTQQKLVASVPKKSRFKGSFEKQHGKCTQTLLKFAWQNLYHIYRSLWSQLTCKKSLLVICKIPRLFPNTLSADVKYSLLNRDNLTQPIQIQSSRKQKTFSYFFFCIFWILVEILKIFLKKKTLVADVFPKFRTQKNLVKSMPKKSRFKGCFKKQHGQCVQTLLKCQGQPLYHIYWSLFRQLSYKKSLLVICKIFQKAFSKKRWLS